MQSWMTYLTASELFWIINMIHNEESLPPSLLFFLPSSLVIVRFGHAIKLRYNVTWGLWNASLQNRLEKQSMMFLGADSTLN